MTVSRSVIAAVAAATIGVSLTAGSLYLLMRIRLGRLVKAAERIAAGDYAVDGPGPRRRPRGPPRARPSTASPPSLAETHDRATIDRLTGVVNRQALLGALFAEVERAGRYERPLSVAFVDIDHFKTVNDTYGHAAGDIVLRGVAQTIGANLRASDMIGRYGGEEFMLILTETDVEEGAVLTEKLPPARRSAQRFAVDGNADLSVTISIGIVGGSGTKLRIETLVRDADAAMYSAKSLGRNQTYIFAEPDDDARVPRAPISDAGRAARDGDRPPGPRGRDRGARLVHRPAAPLPRPAVGAHRLDRRRHGPPARAARGRDRPDPASPPCSTTSARSPSPRRSSTSRRR